ncbi:methyltransferase family protein [Murinocardiopsis flavida]|uniref:Methyltransferase family protein n=1 Tax=Murinocardiopsis flavida TaxID=645275 RepID=A0A2P8CUW8_9ACTN|nr:class I SAM-dependent methyltransferase [Murinocardiopsis flavida]PSK88760.1 methyltransferase family protein [Murinocardiopsis flavida]
MKANGTGPGSISDDGSPVEFYLAMPAENEPGIIHGALGGSGSILELGSGAGRVTHPLLALGHTVTAVDASPDMLAHISGAETVCAPIGGLDLGRTFDAVVLASHLVNVPDPEERRGLLDTCRRHIGDGGQVLIEHNPASFFTAPTETVSRRGPLTIALRDISRPDHDTVSATMHYTIGDRHWTQSFTTRRFDPAELADAGLRHDRTLTDDGRWITARPA